MQVRELSQTILEMVSSAARMYKTQRPCSCISHSRDNHGQPYPTALGGFRFRPLVFALSAGVHRAGDPAHARFKHASGIAVTELSR